MSSQWATHSKIAKGKHFNQSGGREHSDLRLPPLRPQASGFVSLCLPVHFHRSSCISGFCIWISRARGRNTLSTSMLAHHILGNTVIAPQPHLRTQRSGGRQLTKS